MALPPEQAAKLAFAERLEQDAAAERVEYYAGLVSAERLSGLVLDLGWGNGYAVEEVKIVFLLCRDAFSTSFTVRKP